MKRILDLINTISLVGVFVFAVLIYFKMPKIVNYGEWRQSIKETSYKEASERLPVFYIKGDVEIDNTPLEVEISNTPLEIYGEVENIN